MPSLLLRELTLDDIDRLATAPAVDESTMQTAAEICRAVWADGNPAAGEAAVREFASKFGELESDEPLLLSKAQIEPYVERIDAATREMLQRTRDRIVKFAEAQLSALNEMSIPVCGGKAGHDILPIERVGCYAPAGRYPLPSTVLMTAAVARAAGCQHVCLATPRPGELMLATAAIAGADCVLTVGGAQAIAAMAYGTESVESVDLIVGPGNQWVTAAKQFVSQRIGIDMLAGPSELTIIADSSADPTAVAADLLAQAEHDPAARTFLITDDASLPADVNEQLELQLQDLATADTARLSLANGGFFVANSREHCAGVADRLGPEHLQIQTRTQRSRACRVDPACGLHFHWALHRRSFRRLRAGPQSHAAHGKHSQETRRAQRIRFLPGSHLDRA